MPSRFADTPMAGFPDWLKEKPFSPSANDAMCNIMLACKDRIGDLTPSSSESGPSDYYVLLRRYLHVLAKCNCAIITVMLADLTLTEDEHIELLKMEDSHMARLLETTVGLEVARARSKPKTKIRSSKGRRARGRRHHCDQTSVSACV